MEFTIPRSLRIEHEELHEELAKITKKDGKIGDAGRAVAKVLHPHFVKEEEFALPPLGLLSSLIEGKPASEMTDVLPLTERLGKDIQVMLDEHRAIVAQLEVLVDLARREGRVEYVRFAEKLMLHAQTEEEVLYPASILVGEYIKGQHEKEIFS
jgi:hemerythrin superfamily protein